jgi:hypothetical protein
LTDDLLRLITASFIGAAIGSLFSLSVNWMKANRDDAKARCDEFIKLVDDAAIVATAYRLAVRSAGEDQAQFFRLIGLQQRLSLARTELFPPFDSLHRDLLDRDLARFFNCLTGGDAGEPKRDIDSIRARDAQASAADIAGRIRKAHTESVRLRSILNRKLRLSR